MGCFVFFLVFGARSSASHYRPRPSRSHDFLGYIYFDLFFFSYVMVLFTGVLPLFVFSLCFFFF